MGYCLVPNTLAQKMLIITGKGGEGKSRVGVVMHTLLGSNMNLGSIAKVEKSPFARADLQHVLLMVDDDLKTEALDQTNYLKSIITAELPMDLERKGVQSYQGRLNVRFLAFGNDTLQALHDNSHGFFRRQIILQAKERPLDRKDDPYLSYQLKREKDGILLWAIEGLERLIANDYKFSLSRRANSNLLRSMIQSNNAMDFLRSDGYIRFDRDSCISSKQLYDCYRNWCEDNVCRPMAASTFSNYLVQNQAAYQIHYSCHIPIGNGKEARGFRGIRKAGSF
jgi:putative DNA primase/helicase